MKNLYIGTCSWKYDSWRELVYSDKKPINYLQEYAGQYNSVEIDQWFWSLFGLDQVALPLPNVVEEYLNSVPSDFSFTIKVPNSITLTHFYKKNKSDPLVSNPYFLSPELFSQFLELIKPMQQQVGALMFQFEYLNKKKMPSQTRFQQLFAEFLDQLDSHMPCALEIRNPNYLNEKFFRFLAENKLGNVFLSGYYMPPISEIFWKFNEFLISPVVIRLHGPDRGDIEKLSGGNWNRILQPKIDELSEVKKMVEYLNRKNLRVHLNVNNHYEGSAPLTIKRLEKIFLSPEDQT